MLNFLKSKNFLDFQGASEYYDKVIKFMQHLNILAPESLPVDSLAIFNVRRIYLLTLWTLSSHFYLNRRFRVWTLLLSTYKKPN
jgi:hypothetical protein